MKPALLLYIWGQSDDSSHHPTELRKLSLKKKLTEQTEDEAEDVA